jgi:hypothetical protein
MRLVFISSVIATTVLRMTSAVKASTLPLVPVSAMLMFVSFKTFKRFKTLPHRMGPVSLNPKSKIENPKLFDHFVRPRQHVGRNRQADLLSGLEIDDELELNWLLDRQIGGLGAL